MILIIPSIDIQNKKNVRVVQGIPELGCKQYGNDPVEMAKIWRAENAKCIHVVDFDASHKHSRINFEVIREMCNSVIIPVELGGGIRSLNDAEKAFELGAFRLVIGSIAHNDPEEFRRIFDKYGPLKISAAIDVFENEVIIKGRKIKTGLDPFEYAQNLSKIGIERFVVTDVKRNGMLEGPNIELSKKIAEITGARVTLSGGISSFEDLINVENNSKFGIDSVIIGRALYENKFPCQRGWRVAEAGIFD